MLEPRTVSSFILARGPQPQKAACIHLQTQSTAASTQAGGTGTLPAPQASARAWLEAQGTVTCFWCSSEQTGRHLVLTRTRSCPLPQPEGVSPLPQPLIALPKTTPATKAQGHPSPQGTHNQDQEATDKSWLYSRTRGQLCHWQLPSYCTSSDEGGGISMPRHNTASALWDLEGGAGTVTSQQAGEWLGRQGFTKAKDPSTHR